jgi:hypothetical protein
MTRVRIFTVFLIALVAGGGLAYATYDYLQNVPVRTLTVPICRSAGSCGATIWPRSTGRRAPCRRARSKIRRQSSTAD